MTKRELYMAVVEGRVTDEVIEGFKAEIEKIDKVNEERKAKVTPRQEENQMIKIEIKQYFMRTGQPHFIEEVVEEIKWFLPEFTRQRCSALCNQLIEEGVLNVEDVRVKNKGKRKLYTLKEDH